MGKPIRHKDNLDKADNPYTVSMSYKGALRLCFVLYFIYSIASASQTSEGALIYEPYNYGFKHVNPVMIAEGEIPLGSSKTYSYALNRSLTYHVYITGPWVEEVSEEERTDYDIYVYDPRWYQETFHTEAAGLPEHLGTTVEDPYFQPKYTGNYTFKVVNDESESKGAQAATLMVIEHIETDRWYRNKLYMRGKDSEGKPTYFTTWAYEFVTKKPYIEITIEVPETLDMYEVRLYLMANPSAGVGKQLSGAPISPTNFLYGERSGDYGGYNLDPKGYRRRDAFASCEHPGQDMNVTFNAGSDDDKLYHLVFIAETKWGALSFIIKTDFTSPILNQVDPFTVISSDEEATISIVALDEESRLDKVYLKYTIDGWRTKKKIEMTCTSQNIYVVHIPSHPPGVNVEWVVEAFDTAGNNATLESSFRFKGASYISCEASPTEIDGGNSVVISGEVSPPLQGEEISLQYSLGDINVSRTVTTDASGGFTDIYTPEAAGKWLVLANWSGGESYFNASSSTNFRVKRVFSYLSIQVEDDKIRKGESLSVTGELTPPQGGASITITFKDPEANASARAVTTQYSGEFYATYTMDKSGIWSVQASWDGGTLHEPAESNLITLEVKAKFPFKLNVLTIGILIVCVSAVIVIIFLIRRRRRREEVFEEEEFEYYPEI